MKRYSRYKGFKNLDVKSKLLIIFSVAAIFSGLGAAAAQYLSVTVFGWKSTVYRLEYVLPFKSYLNITMTGVPLLVETYEGDEIKIIYNNETPLIINETEYSYTINQDADFAFSLFSADILEYSAHLLLPDKVYRQIVINSTSGDIEFLNAYTKILDISSRSGNITVTETLGEVKLKSHYGNISADFTEFTDDCFFESESGDVTIYMPRDRHIFLQFLTDLGSFTSDFFKTAYEEREGNFFTANGEDAKKLSVDTGGGDLYLIKKKD